jgi:hypothetical protein
MPLKGSLIVTYTEHRKCSRRGHFTEVYIGHWECPEGGTNSNTHGVLEMPLNGAFTAAYVGHRKCP